MLSGRLPHRALRLLCCACCAAGLAAGAYLTLLHAPPAVTAPLCLTVLPADLAEYEQVC